MTWICSVSIRPATSHLCHLSYVSSFASFDKPFAIWPSFSVSTIEQILSTMCNSFHFKCTFVFVWPVRQFPHYNSCIYIICFAIWIYTAQSVRHTSKAKLSLSLHCAIYLTHLYWWPVICIVQYCVAFRVHDDTIFDNWHIVILNSSVKSFPSNHATSPLAPYLSEALPFDAIWDNHRRSKRKFESTQQTSSKLLKI